MCTYCVNLVVFVLSIDVFDIRYNVRVQRLWREKRQMSGNDKRAQHEKDNNSTYEYRNTSKASLLIGVIESAL